MCGTQAVAFFFSILSSVELPERQRQWSLKGEKERRMGRGVGGN